MAEIKTKFINDPEQVTPELLEGYVSVSYTHLDVYKRQLILRSLSSRSTRTALLFSGCVVG